MLNRMLLCAVAAVLLPGLAWSQDQSAEAEAADLATREAALDEREAELAEREAAVAAREAELEEPEEPEAEEEPGPWSGEVSLGYLASAGNTDSSSGTGRVKIVYTRNAWENWIEGKAFGSSDDNGTTAEAYEVTGRSLRNFNPKDYMFGQIRWQKNRFAAYTEQWFQTVGYGHRFLNNETFTLALEAGIGLTQQDAVVQTEPFQIEDTERNTVYTAGGEFTWQVTETTKFEQFATANIASDNTAWETITRIKVDIVDSLALALAYNIQGNTDVAEGVERTDRYTAITLDYSF